MKTGQGVQVTKTGGKIESSWKITDGQLVLDIVIPVNTSATVIIPSDSADEVLEAGQKASLAEGVIAVNHDGRYTALEVASGSYHFITELK